MKTTTSILALILGFTVSSAFAVQGGKSMGTSASRGKEETMLGQKWGLGAQLGALAYTDAGGSATSRATIGIAFDWNASDTLRPDAPRTEYVGISTGFLYAHPGATNADFIGTSSSLGSDANMFLIPIDLKLGYNFTDAFRASVRGGGNLIYRSNASTTDLGAGSNTSSDLWKVYPNVGADLEFQLSSNFSLAIKPDITMTPGNDMYVATLGATYMGF